MIPSSPSPEEREVAGESESPPLRAPEGSRHPSPTTAKRESGPLAYPVPVVPARLTYVFLALTVGVFLFQWVSESLVGFDVVTGLGLKDNASIAAGQYWRLITPVFLHAGPTHLIFNMYALYVLGPQVEGPFGYLRFGLVYLLSGVSGVVLSMALSSSRSVGASGAIFGLVGALAVYLYHHRRAFGAFGRSRLANLLMVIGINLVIGLSVPLIDNWGHLGGLLGGASLAALTGPRLSLHADPASGLVRVVDQTTRSLRAFGLAAFGVGLLILIVVVILFRAFG